VFLFFFFFSRNFGPFIFVFAPHPPPLACFFFGESPPLNPLLRRAARFTQDWNQVLPFPCAALPPFPGRLWLDSSNPRLLNVVRSPVFPSRAVLFLRCSSFSLLSSLARCGAVVPPGPAWIAFFLCDSPLSPWPSVYPTLLLRSHTGRCPSFSAVLCPCSIACPFDGTLIFDLSNSPLGCPPTRVVSALLITLFFLFFLASLSELSPFPGEMFLPFKVHFDLFQRPPCGQRSLIFSWSFFLFFFFVVVNL